MPDRRRRTDLLLPRERQSTDDNNPFAPPPEGRPDQPWQPRHPSSDDDSSSSSGRSGGDGSDNGSESGSGSGSGSNWGSQWSSRQPGRSSGGGFGGRPRPDGNGGQGGPGAPGLRWDPTDPAQRRARYALLSGMWAFFFALFDFPEIALLLGALALYWSISSLRAKPRRRVDADALTTGGTPANAPAAPQHAPASAPPASPGRPQITAAVSGLVMASIALLIVAASFTAQLVYRDYYTCVNDALTKSGQLACNEKLPEPLRGVLGVKE
ncbi:hypothetical protein ACTMTU_13740 [Streptomyces sp. OZ13]|uniref:hypothetical protein n=1 Tax=Streptomyces sp. OZ13 TaxID=3452210 RepID=UPI003F8C654E